MTRLSRSASAIVMTAMVIVLFAGSFVGFRLLTATAEIEEPATCETRAVAAGDAVTANLVSVDVYNASQRAGLANRVSINLQRRGFLPGEIGNSDIETEFTGVTIVTDVPEDARIRLVAAQFGDVEFMEPPEAAATDTVMVLVGDATDEDLVADAPEEVETESPFEVCVPIAPEVATDAG